jgi:hypothetical protein
MDPTETPPTSPADLNAPAPDPGSGTVAPTAAPTAAPTPFKPIPTSPLLNQTQQSASSKAASGIQQSFANVGKPGETLASFNAIYGTGQLSGQPSMAPSSQNVIQPAIPMIPSPALGAVNPANTQINPISVNMGQASGTTISDRNAKTQISQKQAKRDLNDFFNQLNARNK